MVSTNLSQQSSVGDQIASQASICIPEDALIQWTSVRAALRIRPQTITQRLYLVMVGLHAGHLGAPPLAVPRRATLRVSWPCGNGSVRRLRRVRIRRGSLDR